MKRLTGFSSELEAATRSRELQTWPPGAVTTHLVHWELGPDQLWGLLIPTDYIGLFSPSEQLAMLDFSPLDPYLESVYNENQVSDIDIGVVP